MSDTWVNIESVQGLVLSPRRSGAAGSITIAAVFSILLPVLIGFFVAFNPPIHTLLRVQVQEIAKPETPTVYELQLANLTSVPAREVRITLNDPDNSILAISYVSGPVDPTELEMVRRIPASELSGARPELGILVGLMPGNATVSLALTLARPKLGLAVAQVVGPSTAEVGPGLMDQFIFVYPNNLYWALLIISLAVLGWVICYYLWRASTATFLHRVLDNVEGQDYAGTSVTKREQPMSAKDVLTEIYAAG